MKKKDYIIYKYQNRSDVIADNVLKTLNEVYSLAYPKIEKPFDEICQDIHKKAEEAGRGNDPNFRIEYKGTSSEGKSRRYMWPCDFYYIPNEVLKEVWENRRESYGITEHWRENMESLIKFLFDERGLKEVYTPTKYSNGEKVRHSIKQKLLQEVIGEENAKKVRKILEDYAHTYRWGLMDVNQFGWAMMSTPNTNRETVKEAWKVAFDKDIEIPDDSMWIDEYKFADMEYEGEFDEELENSAESEDAPEKQ